ncbi:MFS transporter [Izhakiella australiensis]|uniref:MFS transporter n=1 Tax=Izhakiella australiensis TaxID=1926881 RepID=UPI00098FA982|nr:MFS transporter [Izhakiella australiensis]
MNQENLKGHENLPASSLEISTIKKIRWRLIPYLLLLYAIAYLDRTNISYAALQMNAELGINPAQFGMVASIFFIGYFFFEVPSNIALHKFGARKWIARILVTWGIVAVCTAFVTHVNHLYILRFLLGAAEAGFFPGIAFYLTFWFPRKHRAAAMATFFLAQILCTCLGAPLSGWIMDSIGAFNLAGWRWMILIEGVPAIILGFVTLFVLSDSPKEVKWLSASEKAWVVAELEEETRNSPAPEMRWWKILANRHVLYLAVTYVFIVMAIYGITFWMPTIIKGFKDHFSNTAIGFLVVIPTLVGAVAMLINGWHSDKTMERKWHVVTVILIGAVGMLLLALTTNTWLSMLWLCLIAIAAYGYIGVWWTIPTSFLTGLSAAVGLAAINSVGNLGGFFGPLLVGALVNASGTQRAGLLFLCGSFVVGALMLAAFRAPKKIG